MLRALTIAALLALAHGSHAVAAPRVRFEATGRVALTATGNSLGLAGDALGPAALGRAGAFVDADLALQLEGWPLGTTDDWTLASSAAVLDLPAGARVTHAELVWGGTLGTAVLGLTDGPVRFITPSGDFNLVTPDPATASPSDGTMAAAGHYARSADVTALVEGAGTYRVGGVPSTLGGEAAAGWTLYVAYRQEALPLARVALVLFGERVVPGADPATVTTTLDGLCIPQDSGRRAARAALTAMEGDADLAGDTFRLARTTGNLDNDGARLGSAVAPRGNVFGGHLTAPDGALDRRGTFGDANHAPEALLVGARQGWDLVHLDGTALLASNWSGAAFGGATTDDAHDLLAAGVAFSHRGPFLDDSGAVLTASPAIALPGDSVTLSARLAQVGDAGATDVRFVLPEGLADGVTYVPESFLVDGAPALSGPVRTQADLLAGVSLGNLAAGATSVVTLEVSIAAGGDGPSQWTFAPRITYGNLACPGASTDPWQPAPLVIRVGSCGDGSIDGGEGCDDGNAAPADGCSPGCAVEYGWSCLGPPGTSNHCSAQCGDGRLALGRETCDDGDATGGDGCAADCRVEHGWVCEGEAGGGGSPSVPDSSCGARCGDGLLATPIEACDDGDPDDGDGCSGACRVEVGWSCAFDPTGPPDSVCTASCGDGRRDAGEGCDDGGFAAGDGCDATCLVEPGWSCPGPVGVLSACREVCGDGRIVGAEICDDGRVSALPDGCAQGCRAVDHGWACAGAPSVCRTTCGDGLIGEGGEVCDDGNLVTGDGCPATCDLVESGWSCGDPPQEPSVCTSTCGDGYLRASEGCDDGNLASGDGCAADCRREPGWQCRQVQAERPTECRRDTDEDGQLDDGDESGDPFDNPCPEGRPSRCDDNCPAYANPDQTFPSGGEATWLCPAYDGPRTQGGGGCAGGGATSLLGLALAGLALAVRRRPAVLALALLVLASPSRTTHAQEVDPRLYEPALSPMAVLGVDSSATPGHLHPWASLVLGLVDDELITRVGSDATKRGPLDDRLMLTVGAGLGLFERFELALGLPVVATTLGPGARSESATGLGDLRLLLRARLLGAPWGTTGPGLALALHLGLPTGSADFMTDGGLTAMPQLVIDHRTEGGLVIALNLGYRIRPERVVDDLAIDDEIRLGLGAELPIGFEGLAFTVELLAALGLGDSPHDGGGIAAREVPVEALGGLRWRTPGGLVLTGAAGSGLTQGYGAPDFRVLLSVSWNGPPPTPHVEPLVPASKIVRRDPWDAPPAPRPPPPREELPGEAFDRIAAVDTDADGDGIPVPGDQCPDTPEDLDRWLDDDGCPDFDNDLDGILDVDDKCPNSEEVFNGFEDEDGCSDIATGPPPAPVDFIGSQIRISDRIRFVSGSAELLDSDKRILDSVVLVMRGHPTIKRFRIEGHTDNLGDREFNVDLAERRAWSVRAYLIEQGIEPARLFAKGYGSTRPVAPNTTEAGRAQNRRVEFHVIKDGEPPEGRP